jgi:predicted Zn-ribbon and HTH transcriptional regulator
MGFAVLFLSNWVLTNFPIGYSIRNMRRKILMPPKLRCLRCGHFWTPRIAEVTKCPKCKSALWDKPKPKVVEEEVRVKYEDIP